LCTGKRKGYGSFVDASMEPPAHEAWRLMAEMLLSEVNQDRFHYACTAADVSPPQLKALLSLTPDKAVPMSVLARVWRCDASWATGIVDGLEQKGYVQRQTLDSDRRVKVVQLTGGGESAQAKALDVFFDPPPSILSLRPKDQVTLRNLLRKLRAAEGSEPK
jgi:DNA-binding MarR family transcriptional regulator